MKVRPIFILRSTTTDLHTTHTVIYPLDFETNGHITDDEMHDIMVKALPPGCRMTAIFDVSFF